MDAKSAKILNEYIESRNKDNTKKLHEEISRLENRVNYLLSEIALMRKVMQATGSWDQFVIAYAHFRDDLRADVGKND